MGKYCLTQEVKLYYSLLLLIDCATSLLSMHKMTKLMHWLVLLKGSLIVSLIRFTPRFGVVY